MGTCAGLMMTRMCPLLSGDSAELNAWIVIKHSPTFGDARFMHAGHEAIGLAFHGPEPLNR